jgi:hypothetical protein
MMTSFLYPGGNVYNGTFNESYSDELPVMISGLEFQLCETSLTKTLFDTQLKDLRAFETNKADFKNVYWAFLHQINGLDDTMEIFMQFNTQRYLSKG